MADLRVLFGKLQFSLKSVVALDKLAVQINAKYCPHTAH